MNDLQRKFIRANRITTREREVLHWVLLGKTNRDIALELGISIYTARDHVSSLLRKRGVKNRAQLMALYLPPCRHKAVSIPPTFDGSYVRESGA
jgi:DNA-binding CsgD family transcriptional regulator